MSIFELERAIRSVGGIAHATVRWPDPSGQVTIRLEFLPDADRQAVSHQVLEVIRASGIDREAFLEAEPPPRPQAGSRDLPPEEPAAQAAEQPPDPDSAHEELWLDAVFTGQPSRDAAEQREPPAPEPPAPDVTEAPPEERPAFVALHVSTGLLDSDVEVVLRLAERKVSGHAAGLSIPGSDVRAAATATLSAVRHLLPEEVRFELAWVEVNRPAGTSDSELVQAGVTWLAPDGSVRRLYGSAPVGNDRRVAAARATLDALNRQLTRLAPAS